MKAAYLRPNEESQSPAATHVLEVGDVLTPTLNRDTEPNEVLVKVQYAALNHLDLWVKQGLPNLKLSYPHILGSDASGIVESVGRNVQHVKPGDWVIIHPGLSCGHCAQCLAGEESFCIDYKILGEHISGTLCEYVKVPAVNVFPKPKNVEADEAAGIALVFTTAWQMLVRRAQIRPGNTVLIHAAGSGVSAAAIQIANLYQAKIIATAGTLEKCERAKKLGAHHTIHHAKEDIAPIIKSLTGKRGVDIIFDHVGAATWEKNLKLLRPGGTLVTCGATSGAEATTDIRYVFYRQLSILGSTMGSKSDFFNILDFFHREIFHSVVAEIFPLSEVASAQEYLTLRKAFGKVVVRITP